MAQVAYDSPRGRVEVIGLRQWTLTMLQDSIRKYVPGQSLEDAACMVTLRDSLHFADALVGEITIAPNPQAPPRRFLVIKVVEPEDSAKVRWDTASRDTFQVLRPAYAEVVLPITDSNGNLGLRRLLPWLELHASDSASRGRLLHAVDAQSRADATRLWRFQATHRRSADWRTAVKAIRRDGFYPNRVVATAVLANFAERDSTWWVLMDALRDRNEAVRRAAMVVLHTMSARSVDWASQTSVLRLLLGGTNVVASQVVFETLARTDVSPLLAAPLLRGNDDWLLQHLKAEYPGGATAAHALLVQLNKGVDLGWSIQAWEDWISRL
jgi:hypothetical protein